MTNIVPIPIQDAISQPTREEFVKRGQRDPKEGLVTQPWVDYFTSQGQLTGDAPARIKTVQLTTQSAAIGATDFSGATLSSGLYRVSYYARITTPDGVSSSLTVTFDWTDGGATPSFSGAAITGNTVTSYQSETKLIHIDSLSPIRYSTAYASNTPGAMKYMLSFALESMPL